jgi:SpoVK/Ycf46/Vps4 family AAA+-type ATPase
MNKMKDNAPTTNLRSNPDITNNGLDKLSSFADDKKILHNIMNGSTSSSTVASLPEDASPPVITERDKNQSNFMNDYNSVMSAKSSEFIARAGSGDAFLGSVLGVGGLDDVLSRIRRRVWIPLAAPPSLLSQLGIRPVRGLLLYGDPGCGKTLLARKLGDILSPCRPITIVSGPEIMDKFVGSSEKNLRDLFDNPPEIYHEYKKNYGEALSKQALHVIVLDGKTTFLVGWIVFLTFV